MNENITFLNHTNLSKKEIAELEKKDTSKKKTTRNEKKRQDGRNKFMDEFYNSFGRDKTKQEWNEFLESNKGVRMRNQMIELYIPDMIAIAKRQGAESPMDVAFEGIEPLINHIKAFDPSVNTDFAG